MNLVWIIGNGFDLNLGLETGYKQFLQRKYFPYATLACKDKLIEAVGDASKWEGDNWSDLEVLLGKSTTAYTNDESLFHETFEEMAELLLNYIGEQNDRFTSDMITDEDETEFWHSLVHFDRDFVEVDKKRLVRSTLENHVYSFISLNYSSTFDDYLSGAKAKHKPFDERRLGGNYTDSADDPIHLHGVNEDNGEMVFGVSDQSQIANEELASNPKFCDLWIKTQKNTHYGNIKTDKCYELILKAKIICIYGCSLGETDKYLWCKIGEHLVKDQTVRLVIYSFNLPNRKGLKAAAFQTEHDKLLTRFFELSEISDEDASNVEKRIIITSSDLIFRLNPKLNQNSKYPDAVELKK